MSQAPSGPVFVLAGGGRTGSTLVQRLLISSREVMVWGEHGGILLDRLSRLLAGMERWTADNARGQMADFRRQGCQAWIPNINPDAEALLSGCREFLEASLGRAARDLGFPRWGFKEIRYGRRAASFLRRMFPQASFLLLIRNPVDCLRSIKSTAWGAEQYDGRPAQFLRQWAAISGELAELGRTLPQAAPIRYEDLVSQPESALARIAAATGIACERFDRGVMAAVRRGTDHVPAELSAADREALLDPSLAAAARSLGYDVASLI
ncbi:MAG: sulfotransferase [Gammaproteobacteria bacterium]|nr:sulfotransferase [Gammaproteobacteria bacterium]